MRVLLDTNFLLMPFQLRVDVFSECERLFGGCEFLVVQASMNELRQKNWNYAEIIGKKVRIIEGERKADKAILKLAEENKGSEDFVVATQDYKLKVKLKKLGAKLVFLRGKNHLEAQ